MGLTFDRGGSREGEWGGSSPRPFPKLNCLNFDQHSQNVGIWHSKFDRMVHYPSEFWVSNIDKFSVWWFCIFLIDPPFYQISESTPVLTSDSGVKVNPHDVRVNPLTAKLINFNFHSLEVVSRWRDPQLQVSENYSDLTKWRSTLFKSCWLMSHFILNMYTKYIYLKCGTYNVLIKNENPNISGTGG